MVAQRVYESTDLVCNARLRKVEFIDNFPPICAKDSKTMGFGGVLWVLSFAEERKHHALGKTESKKKRIATPVCGLVRNDRTWKCGGAGWEKKTVGFSAVSCIIG